MQVLSRTMDYLAKHALERQFKTLVGRCAKRQRETPHLLRTLSDDEREVLNRALAAGFAAKLKHGVVDTVVATPELALGLIEHGAVPTNAILDAVKHVLNRPWRFSRMSETAKRDPQSVEATLVRVMDTLAERHPGLDWFREDPKAPGTQHLYAFDLRFDFTGLVEGVFSARQRDGIALGPLQASQAVKDALLDELLCRHSNGLVQMDWSQKRAWFNGLLDIGADPNRRVANSDYEPALCVIARALRFGVDWVATVQAHGARLDEQVLMDAVYVMHTRQHPLRVNKPEISAWFQALLVQSGVKLDLEALAPSTDYYQPTLRTILTKHYPELVDAVRWNTDSRVLEETTSPVSVQPLAPRRRL